MYFNFACKTSGDIFLWNSFTVLGLLLLAFEMKPGSNKLKI